MLHTNIIMFCTAMKAGVKNNVGNCELTSSYIILHNTAMIQLFGVSHPLQYSQFVWTHKLALLEVCYEL